MATDYPRHGQGRKGGRRDIGDAGIRSLKERDERLINQMKLARAQDVERRKEQIGQQRTADQLTEENVEEIEQLKQEYFQNRYKHVKQRGEQEGRKGRQKKAFLEQEGAAAAKKWQAIGKLAWAIGEPALKQWAAQKAQDESSKGYDDANPEESTEDTKHTISEHTQDTEINATLGRLQEKDDFKTAKKFRDLSYSVANGLYNNNPVNVSQAHLGGRAEGAMVNIDRDLQMGLSSLQQDPNIPLSGTSVKGFLNRVQKEIAIKLGFFDEGQGKFKSHESVLKWRKAWDAKENTVVGNFVHQDAIRKNDDSINTAFNIFQGNPTAENLFNVAKIYELRPLAKDGLGFHSMADGYESVLLRAARAKNIPTRVLKSLLGPNTPWYDSDVNSKNYSKPNVKGESVASKLANRNLANKVLDERANQERKWRAQTAGDRAELDRIDNQNIFFPLLETYNGEDLTPTITEMEMKHGKDSLVVTNLKLLQKFSKSNYSAQQQLKAVETAYKNKDHKTILAYIQSAETKDRPALFKKYMPLLKSVALTGFNRKEWRDGWKTLMGEKLKWSSSLKSREPYTLDPALNRAEVLMWEKYEALTEGYYDSQGKWQKPTHSKGQQGFQEANACLAGQLESCKGFLSVTPSGGLMNRGPAQFTQFMYGSASSSSQIGSDTYTISNSEYKERIMDLGSEKEAILSDDTLSRKHILDAAKAVRDGKPFVAHPRTRQIPGISSQEIYQHHIDKLGLKQKLEVPDDLISLVQKTPEYNDYLKRGINHVKSSSGYWDHLITEANGRTNLSHNIEASIANINNDKTETNTNGTVEIFVPKELEEMNNEFLYEQERYGQSEGLFKYRSPDGQPLQFNSSKAAENLSYASQIGLALNQLAKVSDQYFDLVQPTSIENDQFLLDQGREYGWYYVPADTAGGKGYYSYIGDYA